MFNKNIDKRMTELYKYSVNRTAEVDKKLEDIEEQLSKIHQFNSEVRPALNEALERIKKLEGEPLDKVLERLDDNTHEEWSDEDCACDLWQRLYALADYLKVEFVDEGLKAKKK